MTLRPKNLAVFRFIHVTRKELTPMRKIRVMGQRDVALGTASVEEATYHNIWVLGKHKIQVHANPYKK